MRSTFTAACSASSNASAPSTRLYAAIWNGSDYLLGLATFAPDVFARRDQMWERGDTAFYQLNDLLQTLGHFAFRPPIPAYKHSAAQFLKLRGCINSDATHPRSPRRP